MKKTRDTQKSSIASIPAVTETNNIDNIKEENAEIFFQSTHRKLHSK